jgi:large subunit ribosomal protein L23
MGILDTIKKTTAKKSVAKKPAKAEKSVSEPMISQSANAAGATKDTQAAYRLLLKPLVTEKSTELAHHGKYVFKVAPAANKVNIAKAVESLYDVKVTSVNIIIQRGKVVFFGGREGKRTSTKKAIVTLLKGQKIPLFEGV